MVSTRLIESLLSKTARALAERRRFPESTYRLQFNAQFTFRDARDLVPYLHDLGVTDCYASPYLMARRGSLHGYDISDHNRLNPDIGGDEDYEAFVAALRERGLGQLLDVVPNHMGIAGNDNLWWNDVLENGPSSPYAGFFDIDWHSALRSDLQERVLLPMLGDPYGKVLESGQLTLHYGGGAFIIHYFDHHFPVSPDTYDRVLRPGLDALQERVGATSEPFIEYQSILTAVAHLPPYSVTDPTRAAERQREKEVIKRRLATLVDANPAVGEHVEGNVRACNGTPGDPHSFDRLHDLLNAQAYRLSYWRVAADEINYRRFFDVNELAALSMEKLPVFEATHALILRLLGTGKVTGVRIDHPDGLYDPREYLQRLQAHYALSVARAVFDSDPEFRHKPEAPAKGCPSLALQACAWEEIEQPLLEALRQSAAGSADSPFRRPLYVLVEKILGKAEPVPEDWPVHGTTGYEFLNILNGLFVDADNAGPFSRLYERWRSRDGSFPDVVYQKKFLILQVALASELHVLAHQLDRLSEKNRWSRDFTLNSLRHALREIIACFPVYRSYISGDAIHPRDRSPSLIPSRATPAVAPGPAKRKNPAISDLLFDFARHMILLDYPEGAGDGDRAEQRRFVGKFQQVTAPVMAKGVEDTAFYVYNRLLSLNEVGGDPDTFGVSPSALHRHNKQRQERWPYSLSSTATHDTKRGEDVRARLNVLSELAQEWQRALPRWGRLNKRHRVQFDELTAPDRNDEYLFYQTLVGAWPLGPFAGKVAEEFVARLQAYMEKATHEAKVHTSWVNPNPAYDDGVRRFVAGVLDPAAGGPFLADFQEFQRRVSHYGLLGSLSQTLLKIASPGVPDTYQGTELWDFSLVDPDNRRPVDYGPRRRLLDDLKARAARAGPGLADFARALAAEKEDGRVKLYVTWRALHARRDNAGLFTAGEYLPAEPVGARRDHACAFVRRRNGSIAVAAAPRLMTRLVPETGGLPLGAAVWEDTRLLLPGVKPGRRLRNVFTGEEVVPGEHEGQAAVAAAEVFASFPVALLLEG